MSVEWNGRFFIPKMPEWDCKIFYAEDGTMFSTATERDFYNNKYYNKSKQEKGQKKK